VVWLSPEGQTHTTRPGSRLLFPSLCTRTAPVDAMAAGPPMASLGLHMPRRVRTRTQDRGRRIDDERRLNENESRG
jgi:hypothetical protein